MYPLCIKDSHIVSNHQLFIQITINNQLVMPIYYFLIKHGLFIQHVIKHQACVQYFIHIRIVYQIV